MPRSPGEEPQVRLTKKNADKLKRLAKKQCRTLTQETNVAVEAYVGMSTMFSAKKIRKTIYGK